MKPESTPLTNAQPLVVFVTDIGGPVALHNLLSELPSDFAVPILILQPSEALLLESAIGALQRTAVLALEQIEGRRDLLPRHVYFALCGRHHRLIAEARTVAVEPGPANAGWVSSTLSEFARKLGASLTVAFLSGRGENHEIGAACSALEQNRCQIFVLSSSESMVSDLGRLVLKNCAGAHECSAQDIVGELVGLQKKSTPRGHSKAART